eukprot:355667-Chlamydomonas_euryale.AAC.5
MGMAVRLVHEIVGGGGDISLTVRGERSSLARAKRDRHVWRSRVLECPVTLLHSARRRRRGRVVEFCRSRGEGGSGVFAWAPLPASWPAL